MIEVDVLVGGILMLFSYEEERTFGRSYSFFRLEQIGGIGRNRISSVKSWYYVDLGGVHTAIDRSKGLEATDLVRL